MKVLYDHQIFCSQVYGGISRYFLEIASEISLKNDIDVTVLAPLSVNQHLHQKNNIKLIGKTVKKIPFSGILMRALNDTLAPLHFSTRRGVNIYHETYYTDFDIAPRGAARVITVHDMIHEKFPHFFPRHDKTASRKYAAITRADRVICVSENTRRDLLEFHDVDPSIVSVIPHGISAQLQSSVYQRGFPRKKQLLYVGARAGYKNFRNLLQAFSLSRLPAEGFKIVCFGGGAFVQEERLLIEELHLNDRIEYRFGDDATLSELFRESAAFVYPSLYEGFGIPLLEAMSCNCPVICSSTSAFPEVAGDAAEYFDPANVDSIRLALEQVFDSTSRPMEMTSRGAVRAREYTWATSAHLTLKVYQSAN